jgi:DNA-binding LacI/PurR family transcriptional regulator
MAAERAAGVMVATTNENIDALRRLHSIGVPIVAIDRRIAGLPTDSVAVDNESASYGAVTHLIRLGHQRIAMIGGPHDAKTASERYLGYERAFRDHRIELRPELFREGNFRESAAQIHTMALLALDEPPTAIFSVNNLTTIGVLKALREAGVSMPGRMSLVGFDDLPTAELLDPPLTVVQQPTYQLGAQAAELLVRRLQEPSAPVEKVLLTGTLVVRGSTAPPSTLTNGGSLS